MIHPLANVYDSTIGDETKVAAFAEIGGAVIGARCKIQAHAFLCPGVVLEDEVFVGPGVVFTNDRHPRAVGDWTPEPTRVCRGASIGAGAVILPGVTIGERAMIAAGQVVTRDVPAGVVLVPARDADRDRETQKPVLPGATWYAIDDATKSGRYLIAVFQVQDSGKLSLHRASAGFPLDQFDAARQLLETELDQERERCAAAAT